MNRILFDAILSMDAYNRGYDPVIKFGEGLESETLLQNLGDANYIELEEPELIKNAVNLLMNTYKDFLPSMKKELGLSNNLIRQIINMPDIPDAAFETQKPHLTIVN